MLTSPDEHLREEMEDWIRQDEFPCVGAKSALARGSLKVVPARDITSAWNDVRIHDELLEWAYAYRDEPSGLRSLAVIFEGPLDLTEQQFEHALWERIQSLADKDHWRGQPYDERVSADPGNPHFSLSFGGEGYFVVGLHPNASRPARRFKRPTLVFNLHDQFEQLREQGRYERMRETILDRDIKLAGDANPMLSRHGDASEARQYSGRAVEPDWIPPFDDKRA
ncbi:MAG: YqcI/YcgG family protein [Erythrobacter sp.]|nr:MAG: YqcI/YcgG family protein [Erythrobacter sp.]